MPITKKKQDWFSLKDQDGTVQGDNMTPIFASEQEDIVPQSTTNVSEFEIPEGGVNVPINGDVYMFHILYESSDEDSIVEDDAHDVVMPATSNVQYVNGTRPAADAGRKKYKPRKKEKN
ncbi:hypothetical protein JCGZ_12854 [Jatropha curcas]|uniref:Uncharacterized protein n=1 Tax=Jatropha curcas TaxID=180498 RepID=A0A067KEG6_JATCU|nr:hypothetical protein JCGZ_12854 [Jatropha curcas]